MLEIDGSAGGGQIVRTALALSAVTGKAFSISDVRAERPNPGLRPQHLAAVRLLADVTDAQVADAGIGSTAFDFDPGLVQAGSYEADIGTAGSITLLFDTVLPLATVSDGPLAVRASGGTDVQWSPTMDYHRHVKLPLLRRHGLAVAVDVDRRGFYPEGAGAAALWLWPSELGSLDLPTNGEPETARLFSIASEDLADRDVAGRQAAAAKEALDARGIDVIERQTSSVESVSTGSAITIRLNRGQGIAGADALGERGTPAETVGERVVERIRPVIESGAAVDRHLADQLLLFLGLAGGRVSVPEVSEHVATNATVLKQFGYQVECEEEAGVAVVSAGR